MIRSDYAGVTGRSKGLDIGYEIRLYCPTLTTSSPFLLLPGKILLLLTIHTFNTLTPPLPIKISGAEAFV